MAKKRGSLVSKVMWALPLLFLVGAVFLLTKFNEPPPPKKITLVTGSKTGAYFAYGQRYAEYLRENGIEVEVVNTNGSIDNVRRIEEGGPTVIGFVQGGIATHESHPDLVSLGSLYYEPLWIFYREELAPRDEGAVDQTVEDVLQLHGKIAIGEEGSGTRAVALELLEANGLIAGGEPVARADQKPIELLALSGADTVAKIKSGEIQAAFFVAGTKAKQIQSLIGAEGVRLMNFKRYVSYTRELSYLSPVQLYEGILGLARNVPDDDTTLLAPAATLMATKDVHPGIVELVTKASIEIFQRGGKLEKPGEFPSTSYTGDVPLDETAQRVIEDGPSFLSRVLPFWAVSLIRQLKILLIGLVPVLVIFGKIAPALYKWRMNRRIFSLYKRVREIEDAVEAGTSQREAIDGLHRILTEVQDMEVPTTYWKDVYNLRLHIDLVEREIQAGKIA